MSHSLRLAVVSTHPIQYYAPLFRSLAERGALEIRVFFGWRGAAEQSTHDPGFGQDVEWDIPLLEGYDHTFVPNTSRDPGTHHFWGLVNPSLIAEVEVWNPDAVLIFGWNFWSHLRALHHFSGRLPVFFRGDSTLLDEQPGIRKFLRRLFLRWVYRYVDVALHVGQNNSAYFRKHGLEEEQLAWVPHAVENERFYDPDGAHRRQAMRWRRELGIPDEAAAVLFAGKLGAKKAPLLLLHAFERVASPESHLIFAGSGALEGDLRQAAGGKENIHFVGFQNQSKMPVVYRMGDVFVLPSQGPGETWGLGVNEAMACGRPVVVSDRVGCAPDLVHGGENGFVFASESAGDLSSKLTVLLRDEERRRQMGARSVEIIEDWSIEAAAARLESAVYSKT
jgi:glycosyltransferase involved in cell wall biosynthesis